MRASESDASLGRGETDPGMVRVAKTGGGRWRLPLMLTKCCPRGGAPWPAERAPGVDEEEDVESPGAATSIPLPLPLPLPTSPSEPEPEPPAKPPPTRAPSCGTWMLIPKPVPDKRLKRLDDDEEE